MKNLHDEDDDYDYSPNELANLSKDNNAKFRQIVNSNLDSDDNIEDWQQRNLNYAQECLAHQRIQKGVK